MIELEELRKEVAQIKERNKRVEKDKVWETSWTRRFLLIVFTYLAIGFYLQAININNAWLNAIVPAVGFLLSTLTLPFFKKLWIENILKENYQGVIIEESLENKDVLTQIEILKTKVEPVVEKHKTPWLKQWTLHTVEILEDKADEIANQLGRDLDSEHSWYADFKNETTHYIIFKNRVFKIDRTSKEQYDAAKNYGISLGIPPYQVDFHPEVEGWKR